MPLRNRRGRSPTPYVGTNTSKRKLIDDDDPDGAAAAPDYLDDDDQTRLVEELTQDAIRQTQQFRRYFSIMAIFASSVSLLYPILNPEERAGEPRACWTHAVVSSILHLLGLINHPRRTSVEEKPDPIDSVGSWIQLLLLIVVIVVPLGMSLAVYWWELTVRDAHYFHLALMGGNLVTYLGSVLLNWDVSTTRKALEDLQKSKYSHKSL